MAKKHVIKKNQGNTVDITEPDSTWIVTKGVKLSGEPGMTVSDFDDVRFKIAGSIDATAGIQASGSDAMERADAMRVDIAKTGSIQASDASAISIDGNDATIVNRGKLRAADDAVVEIHGDDSTIRNFGKMIGNSGSPIYIYGNGTYDVENHGLMRSSAGYSMQIEDEGGGTLANGKDGTIDGLVYLNGSGSNEILASQTVVNAGKMIGTEGQGLGTVALMLGNGDDHVTNRGLIKGSIWLNGGDDWADLAKGTIRQGEIRGGEGDDVFVVDNNKLKIVELDGEGDDRINTTVSYTLGDTDNDYVETLQAVGKKNVSLAGNDRANTVIGNEANNTLSGGGGDDILRGGRGNDTMKGGDGADDFQFFDGQDKDTVADFHQGEGDMIVLYFVPDIDNFTELKTHMTESDDGADTIITLSKGNRIVITDVKMGDLEASDFAIFPEIDFP